MKKRRKKSKKIEKMEELQNGTAVHMTEKIVKERLKLKDPPEEVRSISLPGKI